MASVDEHPVDVASEVAIEAAAEVAAPTSESVTEHVEEIPAPSQSGIFLSAANVESFAIEADSVSAIQLEAAVDEALLSFDDEDSEPIVVEELEPIVDADLTPEATRVTPIEVVPEVVAEETSTDAFATFLAAMTEVMDRAGGVNAAAVVPALLRDGRLDPAIDQAALVALTEAGMLDGFAPSTSFLRVTRAWQAILCGRGDDLEACGGSMLDEWAADVIARLLGAPSRATMLRRELRGRGVAAFGLVEAA